MKLIAIGDIHGNPNWIKVIEREKEFDRIIFLGDYVDTRFGYTPLEQKQNLEKLLEFKKDNPAKVILLFGNHDYHYISRSEQYSGFQSAMYHDFNNLFTKAIQENIIHVIYTHEGYIFSHAGISKTWMLNNNIENISEINDYLIFKPRVFNFAIGSNSSNTGDDITQSPIWIRPDSLMLDGIDGYIQVVGHTANDKVVIEKNMICIDCFNNANTYMVINDVDVIFEKLF